LRQTGLFPPQMERQAGKGIDVSLDWWLVGARFGFAVCPAAAAGRTGGMMCGTVQLCHSVLVYSCAGCGVCLPAGSKIERWWYY